MLVFLGGLPPFFFLPHPRHKSIPIAITICFHGSHLVVLRLPAALREMSPIGVRQDVGPSILVEDFRRLSIGSPSFLARSCALGVLANLLVNLAGQASRAAAEEPTNPILSDVQAKLYFAIEAEIGHGRTSRRYRLYCLP